MPIMKTITIPIFVFLISALSSCSIKEKGVEKKKRIEEAIIKTYQNLRIKLIQSRVITSSYIVAFRGSSE